MDEHHHHECERYNLENIESTSDSRIYNLFSQYDNEIASTGNWDNKLDGNYYKQTNAKLYAGAYVHVIPKRPLFYDSMKGEYNYNEVEYEK